MAGEYKGTMTLRHELRAVGQIPRWIGSRPVPVPTEMAHLVITVPGFATHDIALAPLGRYLRSCGHTVFDSTIGFNRGAVVADIATLAALTAELSDRHELPTALVGWSLGGLLAREVARIRPELVDRVITFGTPLHGPRHTVMSWMYRDAKVAQIEAELEAVRATPIGVPITAIYSRRDGIVDWQSCIDEHNPEVEHLEIDGAHLSMNFDPEVWAIVATRFSG
jgi:pimeloyl-ACP methyl ester carboxylesterase